MTETGAPRNFRIDSRYAVISAAVTLVCVGFLIAVKSWAWLESGATSVLASLVDSLVDAGVSAMNLLVIRFSLKPADADHRYGHGKAEGIAALFQSAFIAGIAAFLLLESLRRFVEPQAAGNFTIAIAVMGVSMLVSVAVVFFQRQAMRRAPSLAVEADSAHYTSDILVNGGTIVTLLILRAGGPVWIDPLFAVLVVAYLLYIVYEIAGKGIGMLMDAELPEGTRREITGIVMAHKEARGMHDLRTRRIGMRWHISFDIELDPDKRLCEVHDTVREIEQKLMDTYPQAEIMIHMDPAGDKADSRHPDEDTQYKSLREKKPR
jgi:ferrous-iron efflux pump FieF